MFSFLQEITMVYNILAAILHLGNLDFTETENKHHTATKVSNLDTAKIGLSIYILNRLLQNGGCFE